MLEKYVKDNELNIDAENWQQLNNNLGIDTLLDILSATIQREKIKLPLEKITEEDAIEDFNNLLDLKTGEIWNSLAEYEELFTKHPYKYKLGDQYIDISSIGNTASNFFHQEERFKCNSIVSPSPYRVWHTEKFRKTMLKNLWASKTEKINSEVFRKSLALRNYISPQFRVSAAKAIFEKYECKHVLDFSMGWGDRLAGFCASPNTVSYTGIDPNITLFKRYADQVRLYTRCIAGRSGYRDKSIYLFPLPAEDVEFDQIQKVDTIFTSPPLFILERYTDDASQSWQRYKELHVWISRFLLNVIEKAWDKLKRGGHLIINISDVYLRHKINHLCDPMNNFIAKLPRAEFQDSIGYRLSKRVKYDNGEQSPAKIYIDPIWIWRKR